MVMIWYVLYAGPDHDGRDVVRQLRVQRVKYQGVVNDDYRSDTDAERWCQSCNFPLSVGMGGRILTYKIPNMNIMVTPIF
jgi:hypothetical protein